MPSGSSPSAAVPPPAMTVLPVIYAGVAAASMA